MKRTLITMSYRYTELDRDRDASLYLNSLIGLYRIAASVYTCTAYMVPCCDNSWAYSSGINTATPFKMSASKRLVIEPPRSCTSSIS